VRLKFLKVQFLSAILLASGLANAGLISFNDRVSFDLYTGGGVVDDLESVESASIHQSRKTVDSADFSWTMSDYNCENGVGCNASYLGTTPNSGMMESELDDFIWTYGNGNFNFASGITSFGFQFGSYNGDSSVTLNGLSSGTQTSGAFFGIASDDNSTFTTVAYTKSNTYGSFDDVSYTRSNQGQPQMSVPEPSTLAIFALGMMGLASRRFKKQS